MSERPIRLFDRSIHGGPAPGQLGVVCAGPGAGKTAFLVAVGLDRLLRESPVLHVGIEHTVERVRNYYDEIFAGQARAEGLTDRAAAEARIRIERHRRIHAHPSVGFTLESLERTLRFLRDHTAMSPDLILLDGLDWAAAPAGTVRDLKDLAASFRAAVWASVSSRQQGLPGSLAADEAALDLVVRLHHEGEAVRLEVVKDRDHSPSSPPVGLDPSTLLLVTR